MRIAPVAAAASALMLIASPALAAKANPAAGLSVASKGSVRADTKTTDSSRFSPFVGVAAGIVFLVGLGFAFGLFDGDENPESP